MEAKTILKKSLSTVTNTVVEPVEAEINANDNPLWSEEYKEGLYLTLLSALMNAFNDNNFTFVILEGYINSLINTVDCICL